MIITTDAIVLRTMKYRDTSRIATLYTESAGKLSVIAKGERERAARQGGSLGVLSWINAVIYLKEHRDLHLLSRADLRAPFRRIGEDMDRMAAAMVTVELLDAVVHGDEQHQGLFQLVVETLSAIDAGDRNVATTTLYFELMLLGHLGFRPEFGCCVQCGGEVGAEGERHALQPAVGGVLCGTCSRNHGVLEGLSAGAVRTLQHLQGLAGPAAAARVALHPQVRAEVAAILRRLLTNHVEGLRPLKSEGVFASLRSAEERPAVS